MEEEGINQMELEEDENYLATKPDAWQKHSLHVFYKKFSNFSAEESILFNWNTEKKSLYFSRINEKYYENFAVLLVYSKNSIRFYNILKIYDQNKLGSGELDLENYELQLINEFNVVGTIQKVLLYEKSDQTYFIVAFSDAKVVIREFLVKNNFSCRYQHYYLKQKLIS